MLRGRIEESVALSKFVQVVQLGRKVNDLRLVYFVRTFTRSENLGFVFIPRLDNPTSVIPHKLASQNKPFID